MTNNILKLIVVAFAMVLISCGDDENASENQLNLMFTGLENLGDEFAYEGWIMVDGSPKSTGVFTVDENGALSNSSFDLNADDLESATTFILTIEPSPDSDPAPSDVHILAGDFSSDNANLTVSHGAAIGSDFTSSTGGYILATPTDGMENNENSGVWFLDPTAGPGASLSLPALPAGWAYEGWAVIDGTPVTTGTFTSVSGSDDAAPFSGTESGPSYPGEDFLNNAPNGLTFPTDLRGATIVVSVEPVPDNSAAPFTLKPLVGMTAVDAVDHTLLAMDNNATATNPTGTATKK
ncbi:MAG: anti-sigma factor [Saprospiraceae bacterium]|nr:anti-sigma factor [Saprospiraceae bacterium]